MTQNARSTLGIGCLWALLVTGLYAVLLAPSLRVEQFWGHIHPDQAMMMGFLEKNYGMAPFARDFVFSSDPHVTTLYNPLNLAILHYALHWTDGNFAASFFILLMLAIFVYVWVCFAIMRDLTAAAGPVASTAVAALISVASTQLIYFAGGADAWGLSTLATSRVAYYDLPLVFAVVYLALRTIAQDKPWRLFGIFLLCGVSAVIHPVTGYHLFVVLAVAAAAFEYATRRTVLRPLIVRSAGFIVGMTPCLISLASNRLFGVGHTQSVAVNPDAISKSILIVNPSTIYHVMPGTLEFLPHAGIAVTRALAVGLIAVFVSGCLLCVAVFARARIRNTPLTDKVAQALFLLMLLLASALLWVFTVGVAASQPMIGTRPRWGWCGLALLVAAVPMVYAWLVRRRGANRLDCILLLIFCTTMLWTIVGSWVLNAALAHLHSPVRVLEQIRGLRIAWCVYWTFLAIVLAELGSKTHWRPAAAALALAVLALFGLFVRNTWKIEHGLGATDRDWYALMRWVDVSTPRDALLGVATSAEQGQIYFDSIRLKAFTMRSMALSYDAINFVYTNPPQLIAADQRLKETLAVGDGSMPPSQFMRDYLIEYLVISADRAAPLDRVVYKNHTYAVLAR